MEKSQAVGQKFGVDFFEKVNAKFSCHMAHCISAISMGSASKGIFYSFFARKPNIIGK